MIGGLSLGCFFFGQYRAGVEGLVGEEALRLARTMAFATLSLSQLFHAFNLRHPTRSIFSLGLFSNPYLVGAFVIGFVLQGTVITLPGLAGFFKVVTLGWGDWLIVLLFSAFALTINEIAKIFLRARAGEALGLEQGSPSALDFTLRARQQRRARKEVHGNPHIRILWSRRVHPEGYRE